MRKIKLILKRIVKAILKGYFNCGLSTLEKKQNAFSRQVKKYLFTIKVFTWIRFEYAWEKLINDIKTIKYMSGEYDKVYDYLIGLFTSGNDDEKMVLSKLFYFTDILTDDNCKKVIEFALHTNNIQYCYWTTEDISRFTFRLQSGFYEEYYNDRKKLIQRLAKEGNYLTACTKGIRNGGKLCIITAMLDKSILNSTQRVAGMLVDGLSQYYEDILVISLDTFTPSRKERKTISTVLPKEGSFVHVNKIKKLFNNSKTSIFIPDNTSFTKKHQEVLDKIYEYNPGTILDVSDEYSIISYYYSKDYYTVYLPLRNFISSSYFTKILSIYWIADLKNNLFNRPLDINMVEDWGLPEYVPSNQGEYKRDDYGIDSNSFVIVTVGNNTGSCTENFVDEMIRLLDRAENGIWILVGEKGPDYLHNKYVNYINNKRIIEWGYENNLSAFYKMCDVMIRPNMTGGSGATAIAAMNQIPIVLTNFMCDASRWLGSDYSSFTNYKQLMDEIFKMYTNREYLGEKGKQVYDLVLKVIDGPLAWEHLYKILRGDKNFG